MWRNRSTPTRLATSHSTLVPNTFVCTNAYGSTIERSTCDSAAKCTTASWPGRCSSTAAWSQMSPCTNRHAIVQHVELMLSRLPAYVSLSNTVMS